MPQVAPVAETAPSAPPPDCEYDHSGGARAHVTLHAIRRYGDRILGFEEIFEGLEDHEAVDGMAAAGVPIGQVREWLAFYGGVAKKHGAIGICRDQVGLVMKGGRVVTVVSKRGERRR